MLESRARLLRAAVGFALVPPTEPELRLLHRWLDCWRAVDHVVAGMARQGCDLELRHYEAQGWRAVFSPEGSEHVEDVTCGSRLGTKSAGGSATGGKRCARRAGARR